MTPKIHKVKNLIFDHNNLKIEIDGKEYVFDIEKISKRLSNASLAERKRFIVSASGYGIQWPLIDEDLSIDGLLALKNAKHRKLAHV